MSRITSGNRRWNHLRQVPFLALPALFLATQGNAALPEGVASGDTDQTSTILWARSDAVGDFRFDIATDEHFTNVISTVSTAVTDLNLPVKADISGLNAGTQYYYRATDSELATLSGTFKTANALGTRGGLRFGVSGDSRGGLNPFRALSNAAERDLDFFVDMGDTAYIDLDGPASTTDAIRAKYQEVFDTNGGRNSWADLKASTTLYATIDDHEVRNDFAGGAPASSDPRFSSSGLINDDPLFERAIAVNNEYLPQRLEHWAGTGDPSVEGEIKLYRERNFGSDASLFVLDSRSFRDEPTSNALDSILDTDRTMLGAPQLAALKRGLREAQDNDVTWKFIATPGPIQTISFLESGDRWDGYHAERNDLLKFIADNNIENAVFVAGDFHTTLVNDLTYTDTVDPRHGERKESGAFEIITGSIGIPNGPGGNGFAANYLTRLRQFGILTQEELDAIFEMEDQIAKNKAYVELFNELALPDPFFGAANFLGLDDSTAIDAQLLNDTAWTAAFGTYGWTEFEIAPLTQTLMVTTYGIEGYRATTPIDEILARTPTVISQFSVNPQRSAAAVSAPGTGMLLTLTMVVLGIFRNRKHSCPAAKLSGSSPRYSIPASSCGTPIQAAHSPTKR